MKAIAMKAMIRAQRLQIPVLLGALFAATAGYADTVVWTGAVNNIWDTTTLNWRSLTYGTNCNYTDGSDVLFGDATNVDVYLTIHVFPASVTFSNSYTLSGSAISGATGLSVFGDVTLAGSNNYTGPTLVGTNCYLLLENSNALGSASGIILDGGATLDLSGLGPSPTYTLGASASLTASAYYYGGAFTPSQVVNWGEGIGTFNLGSRPVILNFIEASSPSLMLQEVSLSLKGNPFTVNCPSPFGNGSDAIIPLMGGTIDTNATAFPLVTGTAIGPGQYGFISVDEVAGVVSLDITNIVPPFFVAEPTNVTVSPDADITLSFQAGGPGPFSYQWLLNGVMIPGATNTSLTLTNAQPTNGGSFTVRVLSPYGVTNSDPAIVLVSSPNLGLTNDFSAAPLFTSYQATGSGNNQSATNQPGSPNNDGKNGQHPVWMAWQPASSGIATFYSLGSAFDSVLAVYTNSVPTSAATLSNLTAVTADDDGGAFLTSSVQFNAAAGQTYYVVVDGFGPLAAGNIVLSWSFFPTTSVLPVIVQQPLCFVAAFGNTVTFNVQADGGNAPYGSPNPVTYQWTVDGVSIPGATNSSLTISNVQPANVGNYVVSVNNGFWTVQSVPAFLQISAISPEGAAQPVQAMYKLGNVLQLGTAQPDAARIQPHDGSAPIVGLSGTQYFSTASTPTGYGWYVIAPNAAGSSPLLITTEGSGFSNWFTISTSLYADPIVTSQLQTPGITVPDTGYENTGRTSITAASGTSYYVNVYPAGPESGVVTLNWAFNYSKAITRAPAGSILGTPGAVLTNNLALSSSAGWYTDQSAITVSAGTAATLAPTHSAIYGVVNTNKSGGAVTCDLVYQDVVGDSLSAKISGQNVIISYGANSTPRTLYIESSASVAGPWSVPIKTLVSSAPAGSLAPISLSGAAQFYRFSLTNP
jgi:hypothetical protein